MSEKNVTELERTEKVGEAAGIEPVTPVTIQF